MRERFGEEDKGRLVDQHGHPLVDPASLSRTAQTQRKASRGWKLITGLLTVLGVVTLAATNLDTLLRTTRKLAAPADHGLAVEYFRLFGAPEVMWILELNRGMGDAAYSAFFAADSTEDPHKMQLFYDSLQYNDANDPARVRRLLGNLPSKSDILQWWLKWRYGSSPVVTDLLWDERDRPFVLDPLVYSSTAAAESNDSTGWRAIILGRAERLANGCFPAIEADLQRTIESSGLAAGRRVGFLFVAFENPTKETLRDVSFKFNVVANDRIDPLESWSNSVHERLDSLSCDAMPLSATDLARLVPAGTMKSGSNGLDAATVEKAFASGAREVSRSVPTLKPNASVVILLAVYTHSGDYFPSAYLSAVARPISVAYKIGDTSRQGRVRLPFGTSAIRQHVFAGPVPFWLGWFSQ